MTLIQTEGHLCGGPYSLSFQSTFILTFTHPVYNSINPASLPLIISSFSDPNVASIDTQFFIGPSLLVSPVLNEGI